VCGGKTRKQPKKIPAVIGVLSVDSKTNKEKKVYGRDISRRSNVSRNDVCLCPCVITPRG